MELQFKLYLYLVPVFDLKNHTYLRRCSCRCCIILLLFCNEKPTSSSSQPHPSTFTCNMIVTVISSRLPVKLQVWPTPDCLLPLQLVSGSWKSRLEPKMEEQPREHLPLFWCGATSGITKCCLFSAIVMGYEGITGNCVSPWAFSPQTFLY